MYDEKGVLEGVVALRLVMSNMKENTATTQSARVCEFVLPTRLLSVQLNTLAYSELIYASFFDGCQAELAVRHQETKRMEANLLTSNENGMVYGGTPHTVENIITHSPATEKVIPMDERTAREASPDVTLTKMIARDGSAGLDLSDRVVSDGNDYDALTLSNGFQFAYNLAPQEKSWTSAGDSTVHTFRSLCWVGFDRASMQLMFSDLRREFWMSYTLGTPDVEAMTSPCTAHTPSTSSAEMQ